MPPVWRRDAWGEAAAKQFRDRGNVTGTTRRRGALKHYGSIHATTDAPAPGWAAPWPGYWLLKHEAGFEPQDAIAEPGGTRSRQTSAFGPAAVASAIGFDDEPS